MNRRFRRLTLLAAALVVAAVSEAHAAKDEVAVTVNPAFFDKKLQRIAILDVIAPSVEDERVSMMQDMVQAELQDQGEFHLLFPDDLKSAAERAGVKTDYEALIRVWHSRREIEGPALEKVAPATSIDALVGAEVTHWEQFKIDYTQEGFSTTTIGLKIQMFDAKDKTLLWEASMVKVAKSPPYNPNAYVAPDAGGVTRQGMKGVPEPPEYEPAGKKVVEEVVRTFPKEKDKNKYLKKDGGKEKGKEKDKGDDTKKGKDSDKDKE